MWEMSLVSSLLHEAEVSRRSPMNTAIEARRKYKYNSKLLSINKTMLVIFPRLPVLVAVDYRCL